MITFHAFVPDTAAANAHSVTDVFVPFPDVIAMDFPLPARPATLVRQQYIEVYETTWTWKVDALTLFQEDMAARPSVSKSIIDISGIPALAVEAHSPDDMPGTDLQGTNAAFLRFRLQDTEVQVSGGDNLQTLEDIARSMIEQTRAPAGSRGSSPSPP